MSTIHVTSNQFKWFKTTEWFCGTADYKIISKFTVLGGSPIKVKSVRTGNIKAYAFEEYKKLKELPEFFDNIHGWLYRAKSPQFVLFVYDR
jgi:hypothetical protein